MHILTDNNACLCSIHIHCTYQSPVLTRIDSIVYCTSVFLLGFLPLSLLQEEKKNAFFTQPPPLSTEIAFTDMNLSRPLLRVSSENM